MQEKNIDCLSYYNHFYSWKYYQCTNSQILKTSVLLNIMYKVKKMVKKLY